MTCVHIMVIISFKGWFNSVLSPYLLTLKMVINIRRKWNRFDIRWPWSSLKLAVIMSVIKNCWLFQEKKNNYCNNYVINTRGNYSVVAQAWKLRVGKRWEVQVKGGYAIENALVLLNIVLLHFGSEHDPHKMNVLLSFLCGDFIIFKLAYYYCLA